MSLLDEQETPSYDPIGAARDEAMKCVPDIQERLLRGLPKKGDRVVVTDGKSAGLFGEVYWVGERIRYGADRYSDKYCSNGLGIIFKHIFDYRVGIRTAEGVKLFIDAEKVQVVEALA